MNNKILIFNLNIHIKLIFVCNIIYIDYYLYF
ncbi:hypothetical protein SAMN05444362_1331, partial [Dysgonomonas macrotermitis]